MLEGLFSTKQEHIYSLSFGKLLHAKHNGVMCSKITLKSANTKNYEILKTNSHPNIIPIFKLSKQSVYTKKIIPFTQAFERDKTEYNKYIISKVKEALIYVHTVLKKEYRALSTDSLVVEKGGQVLLCNFERMRPFESPDTDFEMLTGLSKELIGTEEIKSCDDASTDIFERIFGLNISASKPEVKTSVFEDFLRNKEILPSVMRHHIFDLFVTDAAKDSNKQYKTRTFDILHEFDEDYFRICVKQLFSVLDSTIRVYLLDKFMDAELQPGDLQAITADVSLGLQVKDMAVKKRSIDFVFKQQFGLESMELLLDAMGTSTDSESIDVVCEYLLNFERDRLIKPIYRLLLVYLISGAKSHLIYNCIDRYFPLFDKIKITKEILPNLCSKLIEKEHQEQCFVLVEKILKFLRSHKDDLQSKESMFKSIKGMFGKKSQTNKFEERVTKFAKEDLDEWKECEFE